MTGLDRTVPDYTTLCRWQKAPAVRLAVTAEDARAGQLEAGEMRAGTLLLDRGGAAVSVLDCLKAEGLTFDPDTGLVARPGQAPEPLHWFGLLPRPEDYILRRSRERLEGTLTGGEWEGALRTGRQAAVAYKRVEGELRVKMISFLTTRLKRKIRKIPYGKLSPKDGCAVVRGFGKIVLTSVVLAFGVNASALSDEVEVSQLKYQIACHSEEKTPSFFESPRLSSKISSPLLGVSIRDGRDVSLSVVEIVNTPAVPA